jgi:hypothetical protein
MGIRNEACFHVGLASQTIHGVLQKGPGVQAARKDTAPVRHQKERRVSIPRTGLESRQRDCRRNKIETIAKPNCPEPIQIPVRPNIEQEMMTMIKVGSKEEVALLLALFGVLNLPLQAPKRK